MTYREFRSQLLIEFSNSRSGRPTAWMLEQGYDETHKDMGWKSYLKKYGESEETRRLSDYMEQHVCGIDAALVGTEETTEPKPKNMKPMTAARKAAIQAKHNVPVYYDAISDAETYKKEEAAASARIIAEQKERRTRTNPVTKEFKASRAEYLKEVADTESHVEKAESGKRKAESNCVAATEPPPQATESLTYTERAGKMAARARVAACAKAGQAWKSAQIATEEITEKEMAVVNALREAGLALQQASGLRSQLLFDIGGKEFCRKELLPLLPAGMGLEQVQACVHIAKAVPAPITTRDGLRAAKQEMQLAFQVLGLIDAPRRKELQSAHARNLFSDFVSRALGLNVLFADLDKEEPMEKWPAPKLDEFLETTVPVVARIEKAKKLRLGK